MAFERSLDSTAVPPLKHLNIAFPWEPASDLNAPIAAGQAQFLNIDAAELDSDSDSELEHAQAPRQEAPRQQPLATVQRVAPAEVPTEQYEEHPYEENPYAHDQYAQEQYTQEQYDAYHQHAYPEQYEHAGYEHDQNAYNEYPREVETHAENEYANYTPHEAQYTHPDEHAYEPHLYDQDHEPASAQPESRSSPEEEVEVPVRRATRTQRGYPGTPETEGVASPEASFPTPSMPGALYGIEEDRDISPPQPEKSIKNTASRFFKKVIPPRTKRSTDVPPMPRMAEAEPVATPVEPEVEAPAKPKTTFRDRLRSKFPMRSTSQDRVEESANQPPRAAMFNGMLDPLPLAFVPSGDNNATDPQTPASPELQGRVRNMASNMDRAPSPGMPSPTYSAPREPSAYYAQNKAQNERVSSWTKRRGDKAPKGAFFGLFKKFGQANPPIPEQPPTLSHNAASGILPNGSKEEPMPSQFEERRRESILRSRRRSRSVGAFELPETMEAAPSRPPLNHAPIPTHKLSDEDLAAPNRASYMSGRTTADSFATAHDDSGDAVYPDFIGNHEPATPRSARNSQRYSQSSNSRLSDSHGSMFSQGSQSTVPTSMAPSTSNLSKPSSVRERGAPPPSSSKRYSMNQFQGSALPPQVPEMPTPALDTLHDDEESAVSKEQPMQRVAAPTEQPVPRPVGPKPQPVPRTVAPLSAAPAPDATGDSKRLSLGFGDDSWLLDLDFDRASPEKSAKDTSAPLSTLDIKPQPPKRTAPILSNKISESEAPTLALPESFSLSPVLVDYL